VSSTLPTNPLSEEYVDASTPCPSEGELAEQRHLVDERDHDFEALAPNTEAAERLALLRAAAAEWQGEWTTRRTQHLYQARFGPGDWRRKARSDLDLLAQQGLFIEHGPANRRHFTLNHWNGAPS
jgi:hypothetical protein